MLDQIEDSKEFSLVTNRKFRIDILDPMKTTIVSMQQNKLDSFQYVFLGSTLSDSCIYWYSIRNYWYWIECFKPIKYVKRIISGMERMLKIQGETNKAGVNDGFYQMVTSHAFGDDQGIGDPPLLILIY